MKSRRVKKADWQEKAIEGLRYAFFLLYILFLTGAVYGVWYLKHAQPPEPKVQERPAPPQVEPAPEILPLPEVAPLATESPSPKPEEVHAV